MQQAVSFVEVSFEPKMKVKLLAKHYDILVYLEAGHGGSIYMEDRHGPAPLTPASVISPGRFLQGHPLSCSLGLSFGGPLGVSVPLLGHRDDLCSVWGNSAQPLD